MTFAARLALIAALSVVLAGCAHGRRERAEAPPSAERTQRAEPERRRARLSIPRLGIGKRSAPSEPVAAAPPPRPAPTPAPAQAASTTDRAAISARRAAKVIAAF